MSKKEIEELDFLIKIFKKFIAKKSRSKLARSIAKSGYLRTRYVQVLSIVVVLYIVVFKFFVVPRVEGKVEEYRKSKLALLEVK